MKSNVEEVSAAELVPFAAERPGSRGWRVLDYSLFMYGLVRGDVLLTHTSGLPVYDGVGLWELDGQFRLGLPYVETRTWLTRLSGLVTASRVEFTVDPADRDRLVSHGFVVAVVQTALYWSRRTPFHGV